MTTLSVIKMMPESKAQVQDFVSRAVSQITSGEVDAVEVAIFLKAMEDVVKGIRENDEVRDRIKADLELAEDGKVTINHGTVSLVETTRLDYSGDLVWAQLDKAENDLKAKKKTRETILKTVTHEMEDPINKGVFLHPPVESKSTTVRVNLK